MSENELIEKAKCGDSDCFEQLFKMYKSLVVILSKQYYLIDGTIEDLLQEGYLGLYKAIHPEGDSGSGRLYHRDRNNLQH